MQHFWHIVLYYFRKDKNTTEMQEKICAVCGEGAVTDRTCRKCFGKFLGTSDILAKQSFAVGLSCVLEAVWQNPWPLPTRSQ